jgi:hypothetical protein
MQQPDLSQDSQLYTVQDLSHAQDYTMHQPNSLSQNSLLYTILDLSHTQDYTPQRPSMLSSHKGYVYGGIQIFKLQIILIKSKML